jgi:hypothetical protein
MLLSGDVAYVDISKGVTPTLNRLEVVPLPDRGRFDLPADDSISCISISFLATPLSAMAAKAFDA